MTPHFFNLSPKASIFFSIPLAIDSFKGFYVQSSFLKLEIQYK